jgi:hypothetical protein
MGTREEIRARRQAVRDAFGHDLFDEISRILFDEDPIGVGSAPANEYDLEVDDPAAAGGVPRRRGYPQRRARRVRALVRGEYRGSAGDLRADR